MFTNLMEKLGRVVVPANEYHGKTVIRFFPLLTRVETRVDDEGRVFKDVVNRRTGERVCWVKVNDTDHVLYLPGRVKTYDFNRTLSHTTLVPARRIDGYVQAFFRELLGMRLLGVGLLTPTTVVAVHQKSPFTRI